MNQDTKDGSIESSLSRGGGMVARALSFNFKRASLAILLVLGGGIIGFLVNAYVFQYPPPQITEPQITEADLPISLHLLQNPIVYEWRGSVKGQLVAKDEHYLTLTDENGNSIIISDITPSGGIWKTGFYERSEAGWEEVSLSDMSLGSFLRGEFFIFKGGSNKPVGGTFWAEKVEE